MSSSSKTKMERKLSPRLRAYIPSGTVDNTTDFLRDFCKVLTTDGSNNLVEDILACETDEELRQLVESIRTGLVVPMRAHGGKTPTEATPSPRSGVEDSTETLKGLNIEPITRNPQLQLRRHCLERDGNKCLATGYYSFDHDHPPNALTTRLEAAHIIPFALGSFRASDSEVFNRHASIWVNLKRYFPVLREMSFTSEQINSEKNMMMLDQRFHKEFGQFNIVFEAAGVPHQYRIKAFPGAVPTSVLRELPENSLVAFRVHKGSWELPDPRFLQIHACIGNFLHMSGQGEIIDKILRDFGDCGGLAPDGGTNLEDLLAVSSLSLLRTKVNETPGDPNSAEKQREQRPRGKQGSGTGNKPWA